MSGGYGRWHLENKQRMQLVRFRRRVSATAHTITRLLRRGAWLGRRDAELRGWGTARTRRKGASYASVGKAIRLARALPDLIGDCALQPPVGKQPIQ